MDLLTVVLHELRHLAGLGHTFGKDATQLMEETLARRPKTATIRLRAYPIT